MSFADFSLARAPAARWRADSRVSWFIAAHITVWSLGSTPLVGAADHYFASDGDDDAAGDSPDAPWRSLARIAALDLEPGDRVLLAGGDEHRGTIILGAEDGGTVSDPVVISSWGDGVATVRSGAARGLVARDVAGLVVRDLRFVGSMEGADGFHCGVHLEVTSPATGSLARVRLERLEATGYLFAGVCASVADGLERGFDDLVIRACSVHHNGVFGIIVLGTSTVGEFPHRGVRVVGCEAFRNDGVPGWTPHSGSGILVSGVDGGRIEGCVARENGALCDAPGGGPVGIWTYGSRGVVIEGNESHHNQTSGGDGGGFGIDGGSEGCTLQHNYSHENHGAGFLFAQFEGASRFTGNTIRFNVSEGDGVASREPMGGIHIWSSGSAGGIRDSFVYGNTVFSSRASRGATFRVDGTAVAGVLVANNVLYRADGARVVELRGDYDITFLGNAYWSRDAALEWRVAGRTLRSLDDWRAVAGQEMFAGRELGLDVEPELVAIGTGGTVGDIDGLADALGGYRSTEGSPLVDRGVDLAGERFGLDPGERDFFGGVTPQGATFDIGAHEQVARSLPAEPFLRGDVDGDGVLDLSDPILLLFELFVRGGALSCRDAADMDDDGSLAVTDAIVFLTYLFVGGDELPPPHRECGVDPTEDALSCADEGRCD